MAFRRRSHVADFRLPTEQVRRSRAPLADLRRELSGSTVRRLRCEFNIHSAFFGPCLAPCHNDDSLAISSSAALFTLMRRRVCAFDGFHLDDEGLNAFESLLRRPTNAMRRLCIVVFHASLTTRSRFADAFVIV